MPKQQESPFEVALTKCYYCGSGMDIILNSVMTMAAAKKVKALHNQVTTLEPCQVCKENTKDATFVVEVPESTQREREQHEYAQARLHESLRTPFFPTALAIWLMPKAVFADLLVQLGASGEKAEEMCRAPVVLFQHGEAFEEAKAKFNVAQYAYPPKA